MTSLFTNNPLRSAHLAPHPHPHSQATQGPPSSFSRSSGVRSQLKKIPSALFNKPNSHVNNAPHESSSRHFLASLSPKRQKPTSSLEPTVANTKAKTGKTRKALADILGWGNNHHNQATPPLPPPAVARQKSTSTFAPPVPSKENVMPHVLKKRTSRPLSGKSSQSGLSGYTSLRAPQQTPQTRARPSMGEDPFSRRGEGAEIVDSVEKKYNVGTSVKSSTASASDKRGSVASSKAFSSKTLIGDEESFRQERASTSTSMLDRAASQSSSHRISAPMPLHTILQDLPPRNASLGRILDHGKLPTPISATFNDKVFQSDHKALKKEKTKSKVWGIFGGKKKEKDKDKAKVDSPEVEPRHAFEGRPVEAPIASRDFGTIRSVDSSSTFRVPSGRPQPIVESSARTSASSRPRLPVLHVQQPSAEMSTSSSRPTSVKPLPSVHRATTISSSNHYNGSTLFDQPGGYESTVGAAPGRPSADGQRYGIVAAYGTKGRTVPKRKSLTGVFGLALKKSYDKIRPSTSRSSLKAVNEDAATLRGPPSSFPGKTLRSLAEEMESADAIVNVVRAPSMPYQSRFGDKVLKPQSSFQKSTGTLRRVASATDKLSALVSFDFSPSPSKAPSDSESLAAPPSLASLDGSPTPMRRIRSAVLTSKKSATSPLKATISPLKLALHRSQVAAKPKTPAPSTAVANLPISPPKTTSLVRKGMRNIFAPPTPPRQPDLAALKPKAVPTMTSNAARDLSDMPADLHAIIKEQAAMIPPSRRNTLGLPPVPPPNRVSPRRNQAARAPPAHSLPPVPDVPSEFTSGRISPLPPQLTLDLVEEHDRTSMFSDVLSVGDENRNSFDFTNEYASLDQGHQRASFVEAIAHVETRPQLPLPPTPALSSLQEKRESMQSYDEVSEMLHDARSESESDDEDDEVDDELEMEIATAVVQRTPRLSSVPAVPTPRKSPFQGQIAFQKHVAQNRISPPIEEKPAPPAQPFQFVSVPAAVDMPTRQGRRTHQRDQSGFSIASMSSVGSVIETGVAGEYTNYFEVNFTNHLNNQQRSHSRNVSTDSAISRQPSRDSFGRHHRRNSSIISVESINEELAAVLRGVGPPVSLHNARRASYISRHRRGESGESFGRSDWAAHRRNSSVESTSSNVSLARLGRPGLGDRMFQLDGGVQLTSITGSPAEDPDAYSPEPSPAPVRSGTALTHQWSYSSILDGDTSRATFNSLFNVSNRTFTNSILDSSLSSNDDCVFGGRVAEKEQKFTLKGLRPDSVASTATSATVEEGNNTFRAYGGCEMSPIPKGQAACHEADGEDNTMTRSLGISTNSARQATTMGRPAKPRRRPANMVFNPNPMVQPETPVLSSPSASEASSRLSLDTKFSEGSSFFSASRDRPMGAGHMRQESSDAIPLEGWRSGHSSSPPRPKNERTETYSGPAERQRVHSGARRVALGWGRRRNSDGPTKVEQMARQYEAKADAMEGLPSDLRDVVLGNADKENKIASIPAGGGKRSLPPMAIAGVPSRIPIPMRAKLGENAPAVSTIPTKKTQDQVALPRSALTQRKSNADLEIKVPIAKRSKLTIKQGRSTGLQIFEDEPTSTSTKVIRPKVSARKAKPTPTFQTGRSVRV